MATPLLGRAVRGCPLAHEVTRDRICSLTGGDGVLGQVPVGLHVVVTSVT